MEVLDVKVNSTVEMVSASEETGCVTETMTAETMLMNLLVLHLVVHARDFYATIFNVSTPCSDVMEFLIVMMHQMNKVVLSMKHLHLKIFGVH